MARDGKITVSVDGEEVWSAGKKDTLDKLKQVEEKVKGKL
jgi:hypothetical protein